MFTSFSLMINFLRDILSFINLLGGILSFIQVLTFDLATGF
jgi:hypothetical protein